MRRQIRTGLAAAAAVLALGLAACSTTPEASAPAAGPRAFSRPSRRSQKH